MILVFDLVPEVHELRWCADVELEAFEHVLHAVAVDSEGGAHAVGVHGAGRHPLLDGNLPHDVAAERTDEVRHAAAVDQLTGQQQFGHDAGQLLLSQVTVRGCTGHRAITRT